MDKIVETCRNKTIQHGTHAQQQQYHNEDEKQIYHREHPQSTQKYVYWPSPENKFRAKNGGGHCQFIPSSIFKQPLMELLTLPNERLRNWLQSGHA